MWKGENSLGGMVQWGFGDLVLCVCCWVESSAGYQWHCSDGSYPWHRKRQCQSDKYLEQPEKVVLSTTDTDPAVVLGSSQLLIWLRPSQRLKDLQRRHKWTTARGTLAKRGIFQGGEVRDAAEQSFPLLPAPAVTLHNRKQKPPQLVLLWIPARLTSHCLFSILLLLYLSLALLHLLIS